MTQKINHLS